MLTILPNLDKKKLDSNITYTLHIALRDSTWKAKGRLYKVCIGHASLLKIPLEEI